MNSMPKSGDLDAIERQNPLYEKVMAKVLTDTLEQKSTQRIQKNEIRSWLNSLVS